MQRVSILLCFCVHVCVFIRRLYDNYEGCLFALKEWGQCTDNFISREQRGGFVCVHVFGPTGVWLGLHAQNSVHTGREGGKGGAEKEERVIEEEANQDIQPAQ